jgi:argininosuccinate lyase
MFNDATRAVHLAAAALAAAQFNRERLAERARQGWITVTELADTLARENLVPFKASHTVATRFVAEASRRPAGPLNTVLRDVSKAVLGRAIEYDEQKLQEVLSPEHFVRVRTTPGGPAPAVTAKAVAESRELLSMDDAWHAQAVKRLRDAEAMLRSAAAGL